MLGRRIEEGGRASPSVLVLTALLVMVTTVGSSFALLHSDRLSPPANGDWPDVQVDITAIVQHFVDGDTNRGVFDRSSTDGEDQRSK